MSHLLPCSGCARHVRAADSVCPFCGAALPLSLRQREPRLPAKRLGRAATFAFGAALAATGCSEAHTGDPDGSVTETDAGGLVALYGGAPDAGESVDAGDEPEADAGEAERDGGLVAAYGGPPLSDAGPPRPDAGGGVVPAYGTPAPVDAGEIERPDAGGGAAPLYGSPPA